MKLNKSLNEKLQECIEETKGKGKPEYHYLIVAIAELVKSIEIIGHSNTVSIPTITTQPYVPPGTDEPLTPYIKGNPYPYYSWSDVNNVESKIKTLIKEHEDKFHYKNNVPKTMFSFFSYICTDNIVEWKCRICEKIVAKKENNEDLSIDCIRHKRWMEVKDQLEEHFIDHIFEIYDILNFNKNEDAGE